MQIYNKKHFYSGVFMVALGTLNLVMDMVNHTIRIDGMVLIAALFLMGFSIVMRSMSEKMAKEDQLEESDERNQLIELKSKNKSFSLTQILTFLFMLALLVAGKTSGYKGLMAIAVGLAFAFSISMFTEIFTYLYYESKN